MDLVRAIVHDDTWWQTDEADSQMVLMDDERWGSLVWGRRS
jgi:hypothetical protein